jgi:hypothetical protein
MAKIKNALRRHYIAPFGETDVAPAEDSEAWLRFAKAITTIEDDSEEKTDTGGDYAGDGNEVDTLIGRSEKWKYEGETDLSDPAQALIASMKRSAVDADRMVWHKIVETDGTVIIGQAKILEIVTGGGDATEFEAFTGHIDFVGTPTVTAPQTTQGA